MHALRSIAPLLAVPLLLLAAGTARAQPPARGALLHHWSQAGARGEWQLRTVYAGGTACPAPSAVRALPDSAFPVLVCQQVLAGPGAPMATVDRVVVLGDTGCRPGDQECTDPAQWPFARVAQEAAAAGGDLIVHVGDYIYRERCTPGLPGPCGDNWATWEADFFRPVGELLAAAPWVFVRGNHEDCSRGGRGWFRFLDPSDVPAAGCADTTDPYAVRVPGLGRLLILDSACAPWYSRCWPIPNPAGGQMNDPARAVPAYAAQFGQLAALAAADEPAWLVTHTPVWAVDLRVGADSLGSYLLQAALREGAPGGVLPASVGLSLFGHIHVWEWVDFAAGRA
ncbi:MAG TPA: metallophosphoesterase, partial [Longimicrobiaceae bacterium]|nr:metallophosphoesterase [Longimicrobiaceae bacterium]